MSGAVFLSRILGLVREQVFAFFFGAGFITDAFLVAFRIPNLLRDLFAEGALSSAFVTVFSRENNEERTRQMLRHILLAQTLIVGIVCGAIFYWAQDIVLWIAPDFAEIEGKVELTTQLTRYFSPFLLFASSAALAMGVLNSRGHFFIPSLGSAAFNLGSIVIGGGAAWVLRDQGAVSMITGFTVGSLCGGLLQWMIQWPLLFRLGYSPLSAWKLMLESGGIRRSFKDSALRKIGFLMAPSILAVAAVQITVFINTIIASGLMQGSVTWLSFSYRLLHFPLGVFGVALSAAALPSFARLWSEGRREEFQDTLARALRYTWVLALGSAAGLIAFREPLVGMIFQHGRFTEADTLETAGALAAYALALPALNSTKIFVQVFYALDKVWIPSTVSLALVSAHYFIAVELASRWDHTGLALATALTSLLNALLLALVLAAMRFRLFNFESLKVLSGALLGVLLILSLEIFGLVDRILELREQGFLLFAATTLVFVAVAGGVYLICASLPSSETRSFMRSVARKLGRK